MCYKPMGTLKAKNRPKIQIATGPDDELVIGILDINPQGEDKTESN